MYKSNKTTEEEGLKMKEYDCSFDFKDIPKRKNYKYLVIKEGDLDINNAMLLRTKRDVLNYLREQKIYTDKIICVIKIDKFEL
jgi:hypothetical protein